MRPSPRPWGRTLLCEPVSGSLPGAPSQDFRAVLTSCSPESLFNQLVKDGKISKSPTREKQRIGVHTMLEMNIGLFRQGLKDSYS